MIGASLASRAGVGQGDAVLVRVPVLGPGAAAAPGGGGDGAPASGAEAGGTGPPATGRATAGGSAAPAPGEQPSFRELRLTVAGVLATGEAEDEQLFLPLPLLREASGAADGALSLIALSVDGGAAAVSGAAGRIGAATGADARPLHAVAAAQGAVLGKLQRMMVLLTLVVLTLSGLCLVTTLMASVVERQNEIGLMRSIGASDGQVARMFLGETGLLALAGGLAGIAVGAVGARLAGARLLGAAIEFRPGIVPVVLVISLALGFISVLVPLRRALAIQPAAALRGE
jgi:putative ABC transport system permease protein